MLEFLLKFTIGEILTLCKKNLSANVSAVGSANMGHNDNPWIEREKYRWLFM
jgi:hypothetical protein